jgi:hypothetical protein
MWDYTRDVSVAHAKRFVLALKMAVLRIGYAAELSRGRPPCSAGVVTMKISGLK